jgi:hypothetical protein
VARHAQLKFRAVLRGDRSDANLRTGHNEILARGFRHSEERPGKTAVSENRQCFFQALTNRSRVVG